MNDTCDSSSAKTRIDKVEKILTVLSMLAFSRS
jgi:hypothetical protein